MRDGSASFNYHLSFEIIKCVNFDIKPNKNGFGFEQEKGRYLA